MALVHRQDERPDAQQALAVAEELPRVARASHLNA